MQGKQFASQADLVEKKVSFDRLSENAYAYTAEGDPNTGVIVGDDAVMVIDTQATPVMAQDVIRRIREVTDKPIRYVVLSHYHAVRVLGASGYAPEHIIASRDTYDLIVERGAQDMQSEIERFPRLFRAVESVPGLTWPTIVFERRMTLMLGKLRGRTDAGRDAGTRRATRSRGCRSRRSCSRATWSNTARRPTPATRTCATGRPRSTRSRRSIRSSSCPAAVRRSRRRPR